MNRTTSGASSRNKVHIVQFVRSAIEKFQLNTTGLVKVLEIASGTGEHANYFNAEVPGMLYQPTEPDESMHSSISQWCAEMPNVLPPVSLNVLEFELESSRTILPDEFSSGCVNLIICINMIHISPFACTEALMKLSGQMLAPGGLLLLYGPFRVNGTMVESNIAFDLSLKSRDPQWGVRDIEEVVKLAEENGLVLEAQHDMPANNLTVIFRKQ